MEGSDDDESAGIPSLIHILPLKLHHDDQISGQLEEYLAKQRGDAVSSSMQRWRMWRNLRFYKSLIGFHEVCAVLISRHVLNPYIRGISTCQGGTERFSSTLV